MINSINGHPSPNFRAITPVKMVLLNEEITRNPKQIHSAMNHFISILLKEDKLELKNPQTQELNRNIRATFRSKITDYFIPQEYLANSKKVGGFYGEKIRAIEDLKTKDYFILTGKDAEKIDIASAKIKQINSKFKKILATENDSEQKQNLKILKEAELRKAKEKYGQTAKSTIEEANYHSPRLTIYGKKEKSGKITPQKIEF